MFRYIIDLVLINKLTLVRLILQHTLNCEPYIIIIIILSGYWETQNWLFKPLNGY